MIALLSRLTNRRRKMVPVTRVLRYYSDQFDRVFSRKRVSRCSRRTGEIRSSFTVPGRECCRDRVNGRPRGCALHFAESCCELSREFQPRRESEARLLLWRVCIVGGRDIVRSRSLGRSSHSHTWTPEIQISRDLRTGFQIWLDPLLSFYIL